MDLSHLNGFEWDEHNTRKNWKKHHVTPQECEQVLFNKPLRVGWDEIHSHHEMRYYALGRTDEGKQLYMIFTIRENRVRIVSARPMSHKERRMYELYKEENS